MDGAKYGAWSNQTNLHNYDPNELRRLQYEWKLHVIRIIQQVVISIQWTEWTVEEQLFFFYTKADEDSIVEREF